MWQEIVEKIKERARDGRELSYSDGAVGITSLLYCPIKHELRQKYPDIQASAVEIDDGFVWERQVKGVLEELFGKSFEEEKVLELEVEGLKIEGHLDTFIELEDKVIGIELKAPKWIPLKAFPPEKKIESNLLIDEKHEYVRVNDLYILQARVQKRFLDLLYPDKKVEQYIFLKGMAEWKRWRKKLYVVYPIYSAISEEELRNLVKRFKEDKGPRFPTECEAYCEYFRQGLCGGKPFAFERTVNHSELDEETKDLLREYRVLEGQLKTVEAQLKKKLKGSVKVGNKEIGWVERKVVVLDEERLFDLLPKEELSQHFYLNWRKKESLIKRFGKDIVKEERKERVWKI